jgi:rRNA-processing protein FCF1
MLKSFKLFIKGRNKVLLTNDRKLKRDIQK